MEIRNFKYVMDNSHSNKEVGGIHDTFEILYIESGRFEVNWIGGKSIASPGSLFVLWPGTPHFITNLTENYRYWYIEFHEIENKHPFLEIHNIYEWNRFQMQGHLNRSTLDLVTNSCHEMGKFIYWLHVRNGKHKYSDEVFLLSVRKLLFTLLGIIELSKEEKLHAQGEHDLTTDQSMFMVLMHLEGTYKNNFSLDRLANHVNLNPRYLIRRFNEQFGMTPLQFVIKLRHDAALSYLRYTDMSVQSIAEEVGFANIYYFSNSFKKRFGLSPQEWRKLNAINLNVAST